MANFVATCHRHITIFPFLHLFAVCIAMGQMSNSSNA